jgi:hypothetical protein
MEAAVFRRPVCGGAVDSLLPVEALESQAKGLLIFRVGGGGGAAGGGFLFCGGGAHGTEGRLPEKPWKREPCVEVESLDGSGGGEFIWVSGLPRGPSSLLLLVRFTSSRDVVDRRCAVNKGDFGSFCLRGVASASDCPSVPVS